MDGISSEKEKSDLKVGLIAFLVVAALIVFGLRACSSSVDYERDGDSHGAWGMAKKFVEKDLRSPSSADFPTVSVSEVVKYHGDNRYTVRSYVDTQNALGAAKLRKNFRVDIERGTDGKKWTLVGGVQWED